MKTTAIVSLGIACLTAGTALADPWSVPGSWETEQREIRFENDGIELVGTLHAPSGAENGPAIVVTHGAGPGTQDTPLYQQIAEHFPALGFSVFVYDRRGAGESGGERAGASYRDLARDAVAAKQAIADDKAVSTEHIGFWGLSQGGWIVMEAAAISDPAFAISVSAPLTTPGEQMEVLAYNTVLIEGYGEEAAERAKNARRIRDSYYRGDIGFDAARTAIADIQDEPWFEHVYLPTAEQLPEDTSESTWILEMDYDPTAAFADLDAPLLFILGGEDPVIPVARTMDILEDIPESENRKVVVLPGTDHLMRVREPEPAADVEAKPVSDSGTYFLLMGHWLGNLDFTSI